MQREDDVCVFRSEGETDRVYEEGEKDSSVSIRVASKANSISCKLRQNNNIFLSYSLDRKLCTAFSPAGRRLNLSLPFICPESLFHLTHYELLPSHLVR